MTGRVIEPRNPFMIRGSRRGHFMRKAKAGGQQMWTWSACSPRGLRARHVITCPLHGNRETSEWASSMESDRPETGRQSRNPLSCFRGVVHGHSTEEAGELGVTPLEPVEERDHG